MSSNDTVSITMQSSEIASNLNLNRCYVPRL